MGVLKNLFSFKDKQESKLLTIKAEEAMSAIDKSLGVIEFDMSGHVLYANSNFLSVVGYALEEVQGKHHSIFCDARYAESFEYKQFWAKLNRGEFESKTYRRLSKNKKVVWIQASYNPILDNTGKPYKVIKFASDITAQKMQDLEYESRVTAIDKSQAVIEFNMNGEILKANDIFLKAFEYNLSEIQGRHHRIFCEPSYAQSLEYRQFWEKLNRGEFESKEYKRLTKSGKEVWIQASYNPIFDVDGHPYKVVKYASDITQLVQLKLMTMATGSTSSDLEGYADKLDLAANQMYENINKTKSESKAATIMADEVLQGVRLVATNTEEMVASIREISRSANESSAMSRQTLEIANKANHNISRLGRSSLEIGEVIKVISTIAQQTNLLALNATIEAARAGDAGRGFVVVANEVKELAKQTAKATSDITNKIGAIQSDSQLAIDAISEISNAVDKLNSIAGTIAVAVEEQTATTNEVSRVTLQASDRMENIAHKIISVSDVTGLGSHLAEQTLASSAAIKSTAIGLKDLVSKAKF